MCCPEGPNGVNSAAMNSLEQAALLAQNQNRQANTPDSACATAGRPEAKAILRDIIHRLRIRAQHLETVYLMLPEKATPEQDAALFDLFSILERR